MQCALDSYEFSGSKMLRNEPTVRELCGARKVDKCIIQGPEV